MILESRSRGTINGNSTHRNIATVMAKRKFLMEQPWHSITRDLARNTPKLLSSRKLLKITKQSPTTCSARVRISAKVKLTEAVTSFTALRMSREMILGMQPDAFTESQMKSKSSLTTILASQSNQTVETWLEKKKTNTGHLECQPSGKIFLSKILRVWPITR